jgi:predicted transcriptional regulator
MEHEDHQGVLNGDVVLALPVEKLMTREVKTCSPEDAIVELIEVMTL